MTKNPAKIYPNCQDLLKTIALTAMVIDHIGLFAVGADGFWMRAVGRGVVPIFCFCAGYNFTKPRHLIGLLGLILTYITYMSKAFENVSLNVLGMIYLGQWYLYFMDKWKCRSDVNVLLQCVALLALAPFVRNEIDYGTLGIAFMTVGKLAGEGREYRSFMPLAGISAMIFCMVVYADYFSVANIALTGFVIASVTFALARINLKAPIPVDLRIISRHSLWIYFLNYGGHLVWFYYSKVI